MGEKSNKKRIISLFVAFTCLFSILPTSFGGFSEKANAASAGETVWVKGSAAAEKQITESGENTYILEKDTQHVIISAPKVPNRIPQYETVTNSDGTTSQKLIPQAQKDKKRIVIESINGMVNTDPTTGVTSLSGSVANLSEIGTTVVEDNVDGGIDKRGIGAKINNLPYGINRIKVKLMTQKYKLKYDASGSPISDGQGGYLSEEDGGEVPTPFEMVFEHGTSFAQGTINSITFTSDVGGKFDSNTDLESNLPPFQYSANIKGDSRTGFRYTYEFADSTNFLNYSINTSNKLLTSTAWIDGIEKVRDQTDIGFNQDVSDIKNQQMIVIKIGDGIGKLYAIEVNLTKKDIVDDFAFSNAGIEKAYYKNDSNIKAYTDKKFTEVVDDNGLLIYKGKINLDSRIGKVKIVPEFGKNKNVRTIVKNYYYADQNATKMTSGGIDADGYIFFNKGYGDNIITIDIQKDNGDDTIVARYELTVNLIQSGTPPNEDLNLILTNPDDTSADLRDVNGKNKKEFKISETKYTIFPLEDSSKERIINLKPENLLSNEVIKVFLGHEIEDGNEADYTIRNGINTKIDLTNFGNKKMIVALYSSIDGVNYQKSGEEYTFYVKGFGEDVDPGEDLDEKENANLSSLIFSDGDWDTKFSKDKTEYTLRVNKDQKTIGITAIAEAFSDTNKPTINARVVDSSEVYPLNSGEKETINLEPGMSTTLQFIVTASDGKTRKTYTVIINKDERSDNANLKDIELNTGDYTFNPDKETTKVRVDQDITSIKVTPIPEDEKYSEITVDGDKFTGSPITVSLKGQWKTEIEIEVTSEDGNKTETYTLNVYRSSDDIDDIDDPDDDDDDDDDDKNDAYYDEGNKIWIDLSKYEEWGKVKGKYIYFDKRGRQVKNAWVNIENNWYFIDKSGHRETGWKKETDGRWYFLDNNGRMQVGWFYDKSTGNQHYFNPNGTMRTGWLFLSGYWYYFDASGKMLKNERAYIQGEWYSFSNYGIMY